MAIERLAKAFGQDKEIHIERLYLFELCNGKIIRSGRISQPTFEDFIENHETEITNLKQFRECVQQFETSPIFQRHVNNSIGLVDLPKDEIEQYLKRNFIFPMLAKLLHLVRGFKFNEKDFNKLYDQMESHLISGSVDFLSLIPLKGFRYDGDEILLEEDLKISPIDSHKLTRLANSGLIDINMIGASFPSHAMEMSFAVEKGIAIDSQVPILRFQEVMRTLRVFKRGVVLCNHMYCFPLSWEPTKPLSILISQPISNGPQYTLSRGEESKLTQVYHIIRSLDHKKDRFLEIAIERFDYAIQRRINEDKLTDCITALEALLLGSEEKSELKYRLSLRLATLLGKTGDQRIAIKKVFSKAYTQRSKIVHGKMIKGIEIDGKKYSMEDLAFHLENYTRNALKIFLSSVVKKITHEKFLEKLDDAIIDPEIRKRLSENPSTSLMFTYDCDGGKHE